MKFAVDKRENEFCSTDPSVSCEGPMKSALKKIYEECKKLTKSTTTEPLTCATDEEYKEEAQKIAAA